MASQNFLSQIMSPGGGIYLLPFTRLVIVCLCVTTFVVFLMGVARIHMIILTFLGIGMYYALGKFEKEYSAFITHNSTVIHPKYDKKDKDNHSITSNSKRED